MRKSANPPTPDREALIKLRQNGMNREQIAEYYGVALSRVKRWIKDLEIPEMPRTPKQLLRPSEGADLGQDYGLTILERAKKVLGTRMTEDYRGYLLDGRPVRIDILVRTAGLRMPDSK